MQIASLLVREDPNRSARLVTAWLETTNARRLGGDIENDDELIRIAHIAHTYIRNGTRGSKYLLDLIASFLDSIVENPPAGSGVRRAVFALLKSAVMHENLSFRAQASSVFIKAVMTIDLKTAGDGEVYAQEIISHLIKLGEISPAELVNWSRTWPNSNALVLAKSFIQHHPQHEHASELDQLVALHPQEELRRFIAGARLKES